MEPLRLFVYGTLKRGQRNHDRYCKGAIEIREAQFRGRLYEGPGFPLLEVPVDDILAIGTTMPLADVATQQRFSDRLQPASGSNQRIITTDAWDTVYGELIAFDDPASRLVDLDYLEGFDSIKPSLFERVLVPAIMNGTRKVAWAYTVEGAGIDRRRIVSGHWSE